MNFLILFYYSYLRDFIGSSFAAFIAGKIETKIVINIEQIEINRIDAILISEKSQTQKVKDIVNNLKKNNIPEGTNHKKIYRPWGNYTCIIEEKLWQVKLIEVNPGGKLAAS